MILKYVYLISLVLCGVYSHTGLDKNTPFQQSLSLYPNMYNMSWNYTNTEILIRVDVATTGWFSFGLTPVSGLGMYDSDFVLGWADPKNGSFMFKDCYTKQSGMIYVDSTPKWKVHFLDWNYNSTIKTVIFNKKLVNRVDVCFSANEIQVSPTNFVSFSLGDTYTTALTTTGDNFPEYTFNLGNKVVPLLAELNDTKPIPPATEQTVFSDNVSSYF